MFIAKKKSSGYNVALASSLQTVLLQAVSLRYVVAWLIFIVFAAIILWKGVWPALQNTRGDFANYYTAARLLAEGKPLQNAYRDFVWFQKQIDRYGLEQQLGGFIPHPPPTALVLLPLAPFEPLTAKRIWIVLNLALAILCIALFARIAALHWLPVAIIFLGTGFGLINNFLFGQMYLLLLATLTAGIYLQQRGYAIAAGIMLGLMIPMKYVGAFFLIYYAWKKEWRVVLAGVCTSLAVVVLALALAGGETFRVFFIEVLPRHLQGEIQDPFAIQFQSWNSMLRRMFVYNASLNPQPPMPSELLFIVLKNLIPWLWLAIFVWMYRATKFDDVIPPLRGARGVFFNARKLLKHEIQTTPPCPPQGGSLTKSTKQQRLFELGLIPLAILLVSPGSATYHFLLLSFSTICFAKILWEKNEKLRALFLSGLFIAINLPHYLMLKKYAAGWLTPIGYMRLWLLVFFFATICAFFARAAQWQPKNLTRYLLPALAVAVLMIIVNHHRLQAQERDGAQWVPLHEKEFDRHLGLLVKTPDIGRERIVFSYGELLDEDYAIFAMTSADQVEGQWTPHTAQKFYEPDLSSDDHSVLMESLNRGRAEIWLTRGKGQQPEFLLEGEKPRWHFDNERFAFLREGRIGIAHVNAANETAAQWLTIAETCYDLAFSPRDERLLFCVERKIAPRFMLGSINTQTGEPQILLESAALLERPTWSPEAERIVFSWNVNGNRDLWMMNLSDRKLTRLTRDPAIDTAPVWDEAHRRILFTSDRG
ncbi:MAG: glycosyltransferase 87 family protein, partial [candidate division KSB1 bacterium]